MARKIIKFSITNQKISGRGGIAIFLRYVEQIKFYEVITFVFTRLDIFNTKGLPLQQFMKQVIAFFIDGTNMSIAGFDKRKKDESYAAVLENSSEEMALLHQIKRFVKKLSMVPPFVFRKILYNLFIWRLKISRPKVIELLIDTMVLDNNDALKRGIPLGMDILSVSEGSLIFVAKFFIDEKSRAKRSNVLHGYSIAVKRTNPECFCT